MIEIRKISQSHEKIYQSLKSRSRLTINDLDTEEELQQSLGKLLNLIEFNQKSAIDGKSNEEDDSMINGGKAYDSESFREDVKKLNK